LTDPLVYTIKDPSLTWILNQFDPNDQPYCYLAHTVQYQTSDSALNLLTEMDGGNAVLQKDSETNTALLTIASN